jgi:hypothetical protein
MRQDADVRRRQQEQSRNGDTGTYLSYTHDDLSGGRYAAIGTATVVGAKADVASVYPAASAHQHDPVPPEPPTGVDINEMPPIEPSAAAVFVEATGDTVDAPPPRYETAPADSVVSDERAVSPPSNQTTEERDDG